MTPKATTGADPKAAARRQNVIRAEQRIQAGRAYTTSSLNTLRRGGIDPSKFLARTPTAQRPSDPAPSLPFQSTLHAQVLEQHHQTQLQALRHTLELIKQHHAQRKLAASPEPRAHI